MASKIDASTAGAGGLITTADNSGILQLQSGGVTVATISSTGVQTNVGAPAFRAYISSAQAISASTFTKLQFNTKVFDTNTNYSTSTYRFTPTVAGYYQVTVTLYESSTAQVYIYKNGVTDAPGFYLASIGFTVSDLVYCNGSTDYLEAYYYGNALTTSQFSSSASQFSAAMVRSA